MGVCGRSMEIILIVLADVLLIRLLKILTRFYKKITQEITQEKILKLIRKNPNITQTQMAKVLGLTRDGIAYNIKQLKDHGIIERIGATKKGYWIVK